MLLKDKKAYHDEPKFYERHRFSAAIKSEIRKLHSLDNWHGALQVFEDWGWIAYAVVLSQSAWNLLPSAAAWVVYFAAVLVIGARQRGLRVNNHQGTHKGLAKNHKWNYFLSTVPCSWLTLESFSGFDDTHNSRDNGHHPNLGTARDVDHMAVVKTGLYNGDAAPENVISYLWSIPLKTPKYWVFLLKNRIFNPREDQRERVIRLSYFAAVTGCLCYFGYGTEFLLYWIVPLLTTSNWIGAFVQLAEHYPLITKGEKVDIHLSRNRILSLFWNFFVGTHQEGYHLIHHLYPKLPLWNMKKTHQVLMQDAEYAALHKEVGMKALIKALQS